MSHFIQRNTVFAWIVLAACLLLLVPFVAMQLTSAVNWSLTDFVVAGILLFVAGSVLVLVARRVPSGYRLGAGVLAAIVFLYVWVELAVGVFTDLGS